VCVCVCVCATWLIQGCIQALKVIA